MSDHIDIRMSTNPHELIAWLNERGYRAVALAGLTPGSAVVAFAKGPNGQVQMALIGESLEAAGGTVKVVTS